MTHPWHRISDAMEGAGSTASLEEQLSRLEALGGQLSEVKERIVSLQPLSDKLEELGEPHEPQAGRGMRFFLSSRTAHIYIHI
jgi:hypothetical protein